MELEIHWSNQHADHLSVLHAFQIRSKSSVCAQTAYDSKPKIIHQVNKEDYFQRKSCADEKSSSVAVRPKWLKRP